jgi:hypothetical protein
LAYHHKIRNWYDPKQIFVVKKLLDGCSKLKKSVDQRTPILYDKLLVICKQLPYICRDSYEVCLFKTAFILAYFGLFRVSELVYTTEMQHERPLKITDISLNDNLSAAKVTIRMSKTRPIGSPVTLIIPCEKTPEWCPVCCLYQYCKIRPNGPSYLFIHADGTPLKRTQFTGILAKSVQRANLASCRYRSHSFRIGRATQLAADGVSIEVIQKLGRWKSDACQLYIRK